MDSFLKLSKQIQDQSRTVNLVHNPLKGLSGILSTQNMLQTNYNLSGLSSISELAKSFSQTKILLPKNSKLLTTEFKSNFPENHLYSLSNLTESISKIAEYNPVFSDKLSSLATSQLVLSNSLAKTVSIFNDSHLNEFNSLQIAISGLSKSYLRTIRIDKAWDDIEIAESVNDVISKETDKINELVNVTIDELENFKVTIIEELNSLLSKTKSEKARLFIFDLMTVLSFLISLYTTYQQVTTKTTEDVINEVKSEILESKINFSKTLNLELAKLNKSRIAKTNVNLRYSTRKNSKVIGLVKSGQEVFVIEIQHKYLLISYLDKDNKEPKSGFGIKKYFQ